MRIGEFDHVVGAAANVPGESEFVVIGSQAILGSLADPPVGLLVSVEVDLYPMANPSRADEIDGALGDGSPFHAAFGYYAHGVGPETAHAPAGWRDRLVAHAVPPRSGGTDPITAWCLEVHDLVLSKCVAGRERDWDYARTALADGLVEGATLLERIATLPVSEPHRDHVRSMLRGILDPA